MLFFHWIITFMVIGLDRQIKAKHVFTSIGEMVTLVDVSERVTESLEQFMAEQIETINKAKKIIDGLKQINKAAKPDPEIFVGNPVNAFLLIKHLAKDLQNFVNILNNIEKLKTMVFDIKEKSNLPDNDDYIGAIQAIHRLQDTYLLDSSEIRLGNLSSRYPSRPLNAFECFELGRIAYNDKDYYHTVIWMTETLKQLEIEDSASVTKFDVLDYLAFSTGEQGNIQHALDITTEMLSIDPTHARTKANLVHFKKTLIKEMEPFKGETDIDLTNVRNPTVFANIRPVQRSYVYNYEYLCREKIENKINDSRLKCRYIHYNPFLYISPVKEELMHIDPNIWMYHDVISDSQIEIMKKLATPRLQRAIVRNPITGVMETADYRVSKSSWLDDMEDPIFPYLTKLVESVTNLTLSTAESWQVANYGIGGQYDPHFDFARKKEPGNAFSKEFDNRIATWLFYLEAPEKGGATVFNTLDIKVQPIRGSAVFWHNLHASGKGDFRTRHAACPVLYGQKWVSNKWIHLDGQEFNRPCNLIYEESDEIY